MSIINIVNWTHFQPIFFMHFVNVHEHKLNWMLFKEKLWKVHCDFEKWRQRRCLINCGWKERTIDKYTNRMSEKREEWKWKQKQQKIMHDEEKKQQCSGKSMHLWLLLLLLYNDCHFICSIQYCIWLCVLRNSYENSCQTLQFIHVNWRRNLRKCEPWRKKACLYVRSVEHHAHLHVCCDFGSSFINMRFVIFPCAYLHLDLHVLRSFFSFFWEQSNCIHILLE